jgi:predicted nucleic acid-binding protein
MKKIEEDSKCITDYVFDECMTVILARLKDLSQAVKIGEDMMRSFEIIYTDEDLFGAAWRVFKAQEGKLSFTDCSIIAAMKGKGIGSIATFDKDLLSAV